MDPWSDDVRAGLAGLPRASGDGPWMLAFARAALKAAPRERGWTLQRRRPQERDVGCPARAGMDPGRADPDLTPAWLPRASGDGPLSERVGAHLFLAAPRERGWTPAGRCR